MNYTNIILQNEFPFEYSFDEMNTPAVVEYSKIFAHLDLSHIQRYSYGVGQNGYDNHSMIKAFKKNLSNKKDKPKRNQDATLGYFSKSNDENTKKETVFFYWDYRIHIIADTENDLPLTFKLTENNKKDFEVAIHLYCKLVEYAQNHLFTYKELNSVTFST